MKVACYLIVEPLYNAYSDKIVGAKVVGVRQRKPVTLDNEARALNVHIELPEGFFDAPLAFINTIEGADDDEVSATAEETWPTEVPDTPESAGEKVKRAMDIAEKAAEAFR